MRSRAHFKSHPLHPILVSFPISFLIGALLFDALGYWYDSMLLMVGYYLDIAGIGFGLLAAIPGIIDLFTIVPPKSSAKKRGWQHGILNVVIIGIFTGVFIYRKSDNASIPVILGGELLGAILLGITGWLGGTLVYRNQIAVDHRYAGAGKWKDKHFNSDEKQIEVGKESDLKVDQMMLVHVKDKRIALGRTENGFVAFEDRCTHRGGPLSDGVLICGTVQCPWHGSQFDCKTGEVKTGPAKAAINTYKVNVQEGKLILNL